MAVQLPLGQIAGQAQGLVSQVQDISRAAPLTASVTTSQQQLNEVASGTNNLLNSGFGNLNVFANQVDSELSEFSTKLTDTIEGVVSPVQQAILETTTAIDVGLGGAVVNAQSVAKNISANIGSSINSIVAQVPAIGEINSFANQLNGSIANVSDTINNIGGTISGISGVISGATSGISSSINNIGGAVSSITGSGVGAASGISNAIGGVTGSIGGAIASVAEPFDKITQKVTDFNSKLNQGLDKINNRIENVTSTLDDINTFLTDPGAIIQGKLDELIDAGISKIMEPINQLVNFGYNLAGQINAATNIVTQELANLTEYVGGIFTGVSALLSNALSGSDFYKENNLNYADGEIVQTENGAKLLSPLRRFNHYNYIITLGILDPEEYNNPRSYRGTGFKKVIAQSGGGAYDRRVQTLEEGNNHMEYFIENLEVDAVIAPNSNTGVALGTTISFQITEPYSMGKFLETIALSAEETGHKQYMQAPYCLKIDFVGWNEYGDRPMRIQRPKYVPIMFTKMDFDVGEQGSTYEVNAVAYSEAALSNNINQTFTSVEASGRTVAEVLEITKDSVGRNLSSKIERDEKNGKIKGGDRYLICFPKTKTALYEAARGLGAGGSIENSANEQLATDTGSEQNEVQPDNPSAAESNVEVVYSAAPKTYQYLKSWCNDPSNINVIGKSPVWDDARSTDRAPYTPAASAYDSENQLFNRTYAEVQSEGRSKSYNWHEGTSVTTMIEDVLLTSTYILDAPTEDREIPFFKWFRIETMVFIEPDSDAECQTGRPRRTYVYAVHPYFPDEAKIIAPGEAPRGNIDLKQKALKEYNYIYTGKNEDIIDFSLNFNQAFYQTVLANFGEGAESGAMQSTKPADSKGSNIAEKQSCSSNGTQEIDAEITQQSNIKDGRGGAEYEAGTFGTKRRIAESIHDVIINSPLNMVTAEMEIWGDPYFIPTEQGNYSAEPAGPSLTQDSTMNYMQNEVLCVVNFRTPLDYKINGFVMNMPELVKPFSGVFQIWAVTNKFSEGQFTQTLKLIRRSNQTNDATGTSGHNVPSDKENSQEPSGQPSQVGGNQGATRPGDLGDGLRGPSGPGQTLGTPLTIPESGIGSLLPPRPTDQIINGANAAINAASQTPSRRPPVGTLSAPEVDLPSVDLGGSTRFNTETGRFESGF
jgi:hypothetical protein